MNYNRVWRRRTLFELLKNIFILFLFSYLTFATTIAKAQVSTTTKEFTENTNKLVVYTDVPTLAPSEFYTIKVRSAATKNEWVECYANITRSLWSTLPESTLIKGNKEHYYGYVRDWSHTYANIEMIDNQTVEVAISAKNGFKIRGRDFDKANAHPAHKASAPTVEDNVVYFTINKPGQITIDINGQMDEVNTGNGYSGPPIHTVSLFANPIIDKPLVGDPNVLVVNPGQTPPSNFTQKTLYFLPGVHDIGRGFPIVANKNYYIPGDAIVYGTLFNGASSGANIRIYGYGTLSGDKIQHHNYHIDSSLVPGGLSLDDKSWKLIWSVNSSNFRIDGVSLMNCPKHTANIGVNGANLATQNSARWVKIITWRSNGDGIGSIDEISDSFIRTQDDCTYVKGDRLRSVFWTDVNGSVFSMAGMDWAGGRLMKVEDCDIIYARHNSLTWDGGRVFAKRGEQAAGNKVTTAVNVTFKDIRITDPFQTLETFYITSINKDNETSGGFGGITFQNITSVKAPLATHNRIIGQPTGIWNDITFDNVVLGGKKILSRSDFASMNEPYVTNVKFLPTLTVKNFEQKKSPVNIYTDLSSNKLVVSSIDSDISGVSLIDVSGKVLYTDNIVNNNRSIDLSSFSSGLIVVKVVCASGTYTQKFLKK